MDELDALLNNEEPKEEEKEQLSEKKETPAEIALRKEIEKMREKDREKEKALEEMRIETQAQKKFIDELRNSIAPQPTVKPQKEQFIDKLTQGSATADDYVNTIENTVESKFDKLRETATTKALRQFVKEHPEYDPSTEKGKERLRSLIPKVKEIERIQGRNDLDVDDKYESFKDAWALDNRTSIEERLSKSQQIKEEAEYSAAEIASSSFSGGSEREEEVELTPAQRKVAAELGYSPQEYAKSLKKYSGL
jgi:hypothetical protein